MPRALPTRIPKGPSNKTKAQFLAGSELTASSLQFIDVPIRPQVFAPQKSSLWARKPKRKASKEGD
jgi:hypothetical protein